MIGLRGTPLTADFEWAKWRRTKQELIDLGATVVMTDSQAKGFGIVVVAAKRLYLECNPAGRPVKKRRVNGF